MIKFQLNTVCKHIQHVTLYFLIKRCCDFCFVTARNSCVLTYYPYALKITVFILWCFNVFCYGNSGDEKGHNLSNNSKTLKTPMKIEIFCYFKFNIKKRIWKPTYVLYCVSLQKNLGNSFNQIKY